MLIPLGLAIWVAYDASRLGAQRGRLGGGLLDRGPVAWFFAVAVFGLIGIVCYKSIRSRLLEAKDVEARYGSGPVPVGSGPMTGPRLTHEQQRPGEKIIYPAR
jgi:hypothetical protein